MDFLRKIIAVCQNHFEKVILILALVGLAGAVAILQILSQNEAENLGKSETAQKGRKGKSLAPLNLARFQTVLQMAEKPPALDFSMPHHLFNPVKWQRRLTDGSLIKVQTGKEVGPGALTLAKVRELYFVISLERVSSTGSFTLGITHGEGAADPKQTKKVLKYDMRPSTKPEIPKKDLVAIREVKGTPEDPELVVELADTGEKLPPFTKEKPFRRVEGYEADLNYPVENKSFPNLREGSKLMLGGEEYKVVTVSANEVVMSASLNDKKYTVR